MLKKKVIGIVLSLSSLLVSAQTHYNWHVGIENHFQFNQQEIKNTEPSGATLHLPRAPFSGTEGVGIQIGFNRWTDSSRVIFYSGIQHIFGNLISSGSQRDSGLFKEELVKTRQTNLKLGTGFKSKNLSFFAGPVIPLLTKSESRFYLEDSSNKYFATYDINFKTSIGVWFAINYDIPVNENAKVYLGLGGQLLNRSISQQKINSFETLKGNQNLDLFAPNTYSQETIYVDALSGNINNELLNPNNVDYNKAKEVESQNYSFSSWYIQFGLKWNLNFAK